MTQFIRASLAALRCLLALNLCVNDTSLPSSLALMILLPASQPTARHLFLYLFLRPFLAECVFCSECVSWFVPSVWQFVKQCVKMHSQGLSMHSLAEMSCKIN